MLIILPFWTSFLLSVYAWIGSVLSSLTRKNSDSPGLWLDCRDA
jgi:hypothetical protein